MTSEALRDEYIVGGRHVLGDVAYQKLLDDHFDGQAPSPTPWSPEWMIFVMATRMAPFEEWRKAWALPPNEGKRLPELPKRLESTPFRHYFAHMIPQTPAEGARKVPEIWSPGFPPTNVDPYWIGFWSKPGAVNPYSHPDNQQGWENGRALAKTPDADIYRDYVDRCREAVKKSWGDNGARIP